MAIIGKIRNRAGLLIGFVGISLLAFILGDLLTSNRTLFGNNNEVAEIDGQSITFQEFEERVQTMISNYKANNKVDAVDQNTTEQLREQAWTELLNEIIYGKQEDKLGVKVSTEEIYDMVQGPDPHPQIKQAFTDPNTGQFNPASVLQFLKNMDQDETGATRAQWISFEKYITKERSRTKYNEAIKGGIYVTKFQAQQDYTAKSKIANLRYVQVNYSTISDSSIVLTDSDLSTFYNKNKNQYKQEAARTIDYVVFQVTPSEEDVQKTLEYLQKQAQPFANAIDDSAYVARYSDVPFNTNYISKGTLTPDIDSLMFNSPVGTVTAPYLDNNTHYRMAKLNAVSFRPDSVKARHILLSVASPDQQAEVMAKADSLKKVIKSGQSFAELAKSLSQDFGSGEKGGDLGWFTEGMMVPTFNDACFEGKKGDLPIVVSQFGIHLIEIQDQSKASKRVRVAFLDKEVEAGNATYQAVFTKANAFAANNRSAEEFDTAVEKDALNKRIAENLKETDRTIAGLESPREVIRWAYKSNKGDVSEAFELGDKYVIAKLVSVSDKGIAPMDQVKEVVEAGARKEKKAAMITENIKSKIGSETNLDNIGSKLNTPVMPADNVTFANPNIPGVAREPKIIGSAFAMKQGATSAPIAGELGVYIINVVSFVEAPAKDDYSADKQQLVQTIKSRAEYEAFNALKEKANITDNRGKFY